MAIFQSVKERIAALNGLGCLVEALVNQVITIDLENEFIVNGILIEADGQMNITLSEAQIVNLGGYCQHYEMLYIKGRIIRYIHIPKELSVRETISKYLKKSKMIHRAEQNTAGNRFRQNKLERYQQETRGNVARIKESRMERESNT